MGKGRTHDLEVQIPSLSQYAIRRCLTYYGFDIYLKSKFVPFRGKGQPLAILPPTGPPLERSGGLADRGGLLALALGTWRPTYPKFSDLRPYRHLICPTISPRIR